MSNLYRFSKNKSCYYCGADPPSNREHIPPKMLFKDFKYSSITVPSCEKHNNEKHSKDQGFVSSFMLSIQQLVNHGIGIKKISPTVLTAVMKGRENQLNKVGTFRDFFKNPPSKFNFQNIYIHSEVDMANWIRHISAGLIWSKIGKFEPAIDWQYSIVKSPNFIPYNNPLPIVEAKKIALYMNESIRIINEDIDWKPGWYQKPHGYPNEIYNFSVSPFSQDKANTKYLMRHEFYNNFIWIILVDIPNEIVERLND